MGGFIAEFYENGDKIPVKDFLDSLTYRAQDLGRLSGVDYAEGFTTEKYLALKNFDGIIF